MVDAMTHRKCYPFRVPVAIHNIHGQVRMALLTFGSVLESTPGIPVFSETHSRHPLSLACCLIVIAAGASRPHPLPSS